MAGKDSDLLLSGSSSSITLSVLEGLAPDASSVHHDR